MKVIQKHVVRIKFDIYVFITNCVAILALSKWRYMLSISNDVV